MIAIIADFVHRFADDMKAEPADRPILERQAGVGRRGGKRVEGDAVVDDLARDPPLRDAQADRDGRLALADAVSEDIADDFVQRDQDPGGGPIGTRPPGIPSFSAGVSWTTRPVSRTTPGQDSVGRLASRSRRYQLQSSFKVVSRSMTPDDSKSASGGSARTVWAS